MVTGSLVFFTSLGASLIGLSIAEEKGVFINHKLIRIMLVGGVLTAIVLGTLNFPLIWMIR